METDEQEQGFNAWANAAAQTVEGRIVLRQLWVVCARQYFNDRRVPGGVYQLAGLSREELASLPILTSARLPGQDPQVSGAFWTEFAHCREVFQRGDRSERHPRWQLNFSKGLSARLALVTPEKKSGTKVAKLAFSIPAPSGDEFQHGLWSSFKEISSAHENKRNYIKVPVHSLRYAASDKIQVAPLPVNAGRGGSLSHFCDLPGCVGGEGAEHLGPEANHRANLDRQRCAGAVLTVASSGGKRAVVGARLCEHSNGDWRFCCRKVVVNDLGSLNQLLAEFDTMALS